MREKIKARWRARPEPALSWRGPSSSGYWTWLLTILLPTTLGQCVFEERASLTQLMLFAMTTVSMAAVAFSDPGVVVDRVAEVSRADGAPSRVSLCRRTNRMIERRDHYCPWIGATVGARNYPSFLLFVLAALAYAVWLAAAAGSSLADSASTTHVTLIFWLLLAHGALVTVLLVPLFAYHCFLTSKNLTTAEHAKRSFARGGNPYDEGLLRNWQAVLWPRGGELQRGVLVGACAYTPGAAARPVARWPAEARPALDIPRAVGGVQA